MGRRGAREVGTKGHLCVCDVCVCMCVRVRMWREGEGGMQDKDEEFEKTSNQK